MAFKFGATPQNYSRPPSGQTFQGSLVAPLGLWGWSDPLPAGQQINPFFCPLYLFRAFFFFQFISTEELLGNNHSSVTLGLGENKKNKKILVEGVTGVLFFKLLCDLGIHP